MEYLYAVTYLGEGVPIYGEGMYTALAIAGGLQLV